MYVLREFLAKNPDTVRAPDLAFVRKDRIPPKDQQQGFAELAPDLAVEVVSPSDKGPDLEEKIQDYLNSGVRLLWIVYPETKSVIEYHSSGERTQLSCADEIQGHDVLPGFSCNVASFFE